MKKQLLLLAMLTVFSSTVFGQFNTVGIIGTATPEGWDASTPMVQDADNPDLWTIEIELADGELKFRADDSWDVNWGGTDLPIGTGVDDGPNLQIIGGDYLIEFNSATGEYFFDYDGDIGIIGTATRFQWDRDVFLFPDQDNPGSFFGTMPLEMGEAKFRLGGDWDVNWGAEDFPEGIGEQGGDNIPIPQSGVYHITFDTTTGAYFFDEVIGFDSLSIIGDATPGGWDEDTQLERDLSDPDLWTGVVELVEGDLKFRAENDWDINWGGDTFPTGIAVFDGDNIVVDEAGEYLVSFNVATLEYSFLIVEAFDVVSIIGDATPGGWDEDSDMEQDPENPSVWRLRIELTNGEALFRANNDWDISWGAPDFPSGVATLGGVNIPIIAGEYRITFNSTTGEYLFDEIEEYDAMSLVGRSGPFGEWPEEDDRGAVDYFMDKDPDDGNIWTASEVQLVDYDPDDDGGVKFRADTSWNVNWGSVDFPIGVGVQDGDNIQPIAGVYDIFFNSSTGEYVFSPSTSTDNIPVNPAEVKLYPNPTSDIVKIDLSDIEITGQLSVRVFDVTGKMLLNQDFDNTNQMDLDLSGLTAGTYILHISAENGLMIGKRVSVMR